MAEYKYFSPETDPALFTCSETGEQGIDPAFVHRLDRLREACGFPFRITSGYRSPEHSVEAKKDKPGRHTKDAADIAVKNGWQRRTIVKTAINMNFGGIGVSSKFVHVDDRPGEPTMWAYD